MQNYFRFTWPSGMALLLGGILLSLILMPLPASASTDGWSVGMTAKTNGQGGNNNLFFGVCTDASDGFDSNLDSPHPPSSPDSSLNAYFTISHTYFSRLDQDYRAEAQSIQWQFTVVSTEESSITWDTSAVPPEISITMLGVGLVIDMKSVSSTALGSGTNNLTITATGPSTGSAVAPSGGNPSNTTEEDGSANTVTAAASNTVELDARSSPVNSQTENSAATVSSPGPASDNNQDSLSAPLAGNKMADLPAGESSGTAFNWRTLWVPAGFILAGGVVAAFILNNRRKGHIRLNK